jgi:hypothetical protein
METVALPEGFEEIRREELARAFQKVLRLRYFVQPVLALVVLYIALYEWHPGAPSVEGCSRRRAPTSMCSTFVALAEGARRPAPAASLNKLRQAPVTVGTGHYTRKPSGRTGHRDIVRAWTPTGQPPPR